MFIQNVVFYCLEKAYKKAYVFGGQYMLYNLSMVILISDLRRLIDCNNVFGIFLWPVHTEFSLCTPPPQKLKD